MVLDTSFLNTQQYKIRIKGKEEQGKGVAPSITTRSSSYGKGSFLVALDYDRPLYFFYKKNMAVYTSSIQGEIEYLICWAKAQVL